MRVLIATAVDIERDAVMHGLQDLAQCDVITVGVGSVAAGVNTAIKLATTPYQLVINMGIAGGFTSRATVGSIIIADEVICADLGVETLEGFVSLDRLGFGPTRKKIQPSLIMHIKTAFTSAGISTTIGPILTVSTTTGTAETATQLSSRIPSAVAEAMEGFGIASAAQAYNVPFIEIRTISNPIGPRDKTMWSTEEALHMLTIASNILENEVLNEDRIFTLSE